ncbi:iron chelate uptake ABC transporter family permease subunit, partial [Streptomyces sp. NPDC006464]|uniref:iron chelate uptake ABC transporter family permease subunit n=1 Tax=Streptomyces sp. NPDC006464 TaxID=3154305 RepID=UPI00339ECCAA
MEEEDGRRWAARLYTRRIDSSTGDGGTSSGGSGPGGRSRTTWSAPQPPAARAPASRDSSSPRPAGRGGAAGLAALVGASLAVCGAVLQAVTRNALADPYLLGVSS